MFDIKVENVYNYVKYNIIVGDMIMAIVIILFVIGAFIAALSGDMSGVEFIGKGVLFIGLFIAIGGVFVLFINAASYPLFWLVILVLVIAVLMIIFIVTYDKKRNDTHTNNDNHENIRTTNNTTDIHSEDNLSDTSATKTQTPTKFQAEIAKKALSTSQVQQKQLNQMYKDLDDKASRAVDDIMSGLLTAAERSGYSSSSLGKTVVYDYKDRTLSEFVYVKQEYQHSGVLFGSHTTEYLTGVIKNYSKYNYYLSKLRQLCDKEGISIQPTLLALDSIHDRVLDSCEFPGRIVGRRIVSRSAVVLRCEITF